MKIWQDKKIIALGIILMVFTIGYFIIVNKISYAFETNYNVEEEYNSTIETIKASAIAYGSNHLDLFNESDTVYIKVQDLIDNNVLIPDEEGNITNPLKTNESLNSNIVKMKYENQEVSAEVDS